MGTSKRETITVLSAVCNTWFVNVWHAVADTTEGGNAQDHFGMTTIKALVCRYRFNGIDTCIRGFEAANSTVMCQAGCSNATCPPRQGLSCDLSTYAYETEHLSHELAGFVRRTENRDLHRRGMYARFWEHIEKRESYCTAVASSPISSLRMTARVKVRGNFYSRGRGGGGVGARENDCCR